MKSQLLPAIIVIAGFMACGDPQPAQQKSTEVPKALKENSDGYEFSSKRGKDDLVENLYRELAGKSPELNALEMNIRNLQTSRFDSSKEYDNYKEPILSYYGSAKNHLEQISDSTLKEKIRQILSLSLEKYHSGTAKHDNILKSIESKNHTLNDLHTVLKIMRTLPIMEKFQKENLPGTSPLEGFEKRLDVTIKTADSLVKN
jgi:hypothetical protein